MNTHTFVWVLLAFTLYLASTALGANWMQVEILQVGPIQPTGIAFLAKVSGSSEAPRTYVLSVTDKKIEEYYFQILLTCVTSGKPAVIDVSSNTIAGMPAVVQLAIQAIPK